MRWLIDRLAPPPDLPPSGDDDAMLVLRHRMDSLYAATTDRRIDAARGELARQRARLLRLGEVWAQRDGALD
jgi:hypothetical protein